MSEAFASWCGTTAHDSVAEECARAAVVFTYSVIVVRIAGRRIVAAWAAPGHRQETRHCLGRWRR